jgi:hypothetical protein
MKKVGTLIVLALFFLTITSCSGHDELDITVDNVEISGNNSDLISVVPGTYSIVKTERGLAIKVKFKLEKTIYNADSVDTYAISGGGIEFDNFSDGLTLVCTDTNGMSIGTKFDLGEESLDIDANASFKKFLTSSAGTEKEFIFSSSTSDTKDVMTKTKGFKIEGMSVSVQSGDYPISSSTDDSNVSDTTSSSTSDEASVSSDDSSIGDVDAALDEYEQYVNKYIRMMKKASKGDPTAIAEYAEMLQSAQNFQEKLDNAKEDFTSAQMARLVKIEAKLMKAAQP